MIDRAAAITSLRPGALWAMDGNDVANIIWLTEGVEPLTVAEVDAEVARLEAAAEWDRLRAERDRRLAACDWRVMPDAPDYGLVYYRDLWVQYRQALRDLPANTSDPREAVWPEEPS